MDKLKDIKTIVNVPDYSFYQFLCLVFIFLGIVVVIVYFLYKKFYKQEKVYEFDLNNSKETAYKLIELINNREESDEYISKLHNYTYKKEVPEFDRKLFDEIVKKFKLKVILK